MQIKLLSELGNSFYLKKSKKISISLAVSAILGFPQYANAFVVGVKTSVDAIDKTTSLGYQLLLALAGLMIVAIFAVAVWALIMGPGEGVMKYLIRGASACVILAIGFWVAPGYYNFCL